MVHQYVRLFRDFGANVQALVKSNAGHVSSVMCHNKNAAARFIQLHDSATALTGGETALVSILVPAQSAVVVGTQFFGPGVQFQNGIVVAFSTTDGTYTAGTAADQTTHVTYY